MGSRVVRIDPLHFLARYKMGLNHVLSVLYLSMFLIVLLFIRAHFYVIINLHCYVFCLMVILVKLSVLAK